MGQAALVDHFLPPFFLLVRFGLPPSLPHSRMRRVNSCLPHSFFRDSALLLSVKI